MKKIILALAVLASLSSVALASNHTYHSNKNLSHLRQDRGLTCEDFHNCQTIYQPIYQEAGYNLLCKYGYCF